MYTKDVLDVALAHSGARTVTECQIGTQREYLSSDSRHSKKNSDNMPLLFFGKPLEVPPADS